jgi:hypothetical protein
MIFLEESKKFSREQVAGAFGRDRRSIGKISMFKTMGSVIFLVGWKIRGCSLPGRETAALGGIERNEGSAERRLLSARKSAT